jgi:hypothetical protein
MAEWAGKSVSYQNASGRTITGTILDCIEQEEASSIPGRRKRLVLQRIDFSESALEPAVRFRVGYYVRNGRRWVWARNTPIMSQESLQSLWRQAHEKGWL